MVAIDRSSALEDCRPLGYRGGSYVKHVGIFVAGTVFGLIISNMTCNITYDHSAILLLPASKTNVIDNNKNSPDFLAIGRRAGTDKVLGEVALPECLQESKKCYWPGAVNPKCLIFGHFYHTLYNAWLRTPEYTSIDAEPFQALEIGFYTGSGYQTYTEFLSPQAIVHSIEINCSKGWQENNLASTYPRYSELLKKRLLHCGDAANYDHLHHVWTNEIKKRMHPLKLVIDDASHLADHMATSLFFWFPRLAPGGLFIMEDIEPTVPANPFRAHVLPQVLFDLHYCGKKKPL